QACDRRGDRPDPHRHGAGRHGRDGLAGHRGAQQRARRLFVQNRPLDARPVALEHRGEGARRGGDGRRKDHIPRNQVTPWLALQPASLFAPGRAAGGGGVFWPARLPAGVPASAVTPENTAAAAERKILYYRDPSGAPYWSAEPKKDADGRDYLPVYQDEEISFEPGAKPPATAGGPRKILYYRNPMGLPDTSPVPKKDWMGMDYIPVYEGEEQDDGKTVKVSLDKIQRSGVRTESVEARVVVRPIRAVGTVMHDESRLTV